jgi:serine/threonine-protein kinase
VKLLQSNLGHRQRLGNYELIGLVASGGMASVYVARPLATARSRGTVAVKVLHRHLADDPELVRMFLDEFRIAQRVVHPNVVPVLESGTAEGRPYLVMQYVPGDTLAELLTLSAETGMALPIGVGIRVVIDMLLGLHAAHESRDAHGIPVELVHRDVSPQNVLVGADGVARLIDFGLAQVRADVAASQSAATKGKFAYLAPEEVTGSSQLDRRADVFAAGIVLWEVLTSRRLFRSSNDAATLTRVVSEPIDPPQRWAPNVPDAVGALCLQALERTPSARIPSARDFAQMLESAACDVVADHVAVARYLERCMGERLAREREAIESTANAMVQPPPAHGARRVMRFILLAGLLVMTACLGLVMVWGLCSIAGIHVVPKPGQAP